MAEIGANEGEVCFFYIYLFDTGDTGNGLGIKDAAADTVNGIGGIYNNTAIAQALHSSGYISRLWIIGMYVQQHGGLFTIKLPLLAAIFILLGPQLT